MPFKRISGFISKIQMIRDAKQFRNSKDDVGTPQLNIIDECNEHEDSSSTLRFYAADFKSYWPDSRGTVETSSDFSYSVAETQYESSESDFAPLTRQRACSNVALALNVRSSVDHKALVVKPTHNAEITNEEDLGVKLRNKKVTISNDYNR